MKKKIYILTVVDLEKVGYQCSDVRVFNNLEEANEVMASEYNERCKEWDIEDPFEQGTLEFGYDKYNFAFVFGECYWDIFEKEIEI